MNSRKRPNGFERCLAAALVIAFASQQGCGGGGNATVPITPRFPAVAYQIDVAHTGSISFGTPLVYPRSPAWSVELSGLISYPLIVGNAVYVTTSNRDLYALDKSTGSAIWGPRKIGGPPIYSPWSGLAYDGGRVFIQYATGFLQAFDAATGAQAWSVQLPIQYSFSSAPTASNGIVYVGGAGHGGTLYAVSEQSGAILWTASVSNGDQSSPAISADGLFVSYPCVIYKFDPLSGATVWLHTGGCSGGGGRTPAYKNGRLYVRDGSGDAAGIYDAASGVKVASLISDTIPALGDTMGFYQTGGFGSQSRGTVRGVDLATGVVRWSFSGDGQISSAPIIVNQVVFVGSGSGTVFALDAATGAQLWSGSAGAPIAPPDEQNTSQPSTGIGAGEGYLVVPAGSKLTAWQLATL